MKKLVLCLLLLFFASEVLVLADNDVKCDEKGVYIHAGNLDARQTLLGGESFFLIDNKPQATMTSFTGWNIQELRYMVALPRGTDPLVTYNLGRTRKIGNIKLQELKGNGAIKPEIAITEHLKPFARFENTGIERGVRIGTIVIQPFDYDPATNELSIIDVADVKLSFGTSVPYKETGANDRDYSLFTPIENTGHLPALMKETEKQTGRDKLLDNTTWYNPATKYARLATTNDGIATIDASSIITAQPEFGGKSTKYFHLLYMGNEIPFGVVNDNDGALTNGDRIYFQGRRAEGDTTWFNTYAKEASFFLFYDESSEGQRLENFPPASATETLRSARVDKHYEKDVYYGFGRDILETEKQPGEGWFWKRVSRGDGGVYWDSLAYTFRLPLVLLPSDVPGDSLTISAHVESMEWDDNSDAKGEWHQVDMLLNADNAVSQYNVMKLTQADVSNKFGAGGLLAGANDLKILNHLRVYQNQVIHDAFGLDYITVKGMEKPVAENSMADIYVDDLKGDHSIEIPGFQDRKVIVIDTINHYISFPQAYPGAVIYVNSKGGSRPYASVFINDSLVISGDSWGVYYDDKLSDTNYKAGVYIGYRTKDNSVTGGKCFAAPGDEAAAYIKSIPAGSAIGIASNSASQASQEFINTLTGLGSSRAKDAGNGTSWAFAAVQGITSTAKEAISGSSPVSVGGFVPFEGGSYYTMTQNLAGGKSYRLMAASSGSAEEATASAVNQTNWVDATNRADVIIITHKDLKLAADSLASHRRRMNPEYSTIVVDVDDIYKEFNYGLKSPHAIKNFLKNAYKNWVKPAPKYLVLFGDANWDSRNVVPGPKFKDFVPVYGYPNSDYWYVLLDGDDLLPEMSIGRIPAKSEREGLDYINKVIDHDTSSWAPWMKKFVFLSGGATADEVSHFFVYTNKLIQTLIEKSGNQICCDTALIIKKSFVDGQSVSEVEGPAIREQINNGAMWTTFLGHGSTTVIDMDGWQAEKLNNKGKYGYLSTLSCNTGAFADYALTSRNENYLFYPDKGFVCVGGSTATSSAEVDFYLQLYIYNQLINRDPKYWSYGDLLSKSKSKLENSGYSRYTAMDYTLLGDPLVKMNYSINPDLYVPGKDVKVRNKQGDALITEEDDSALVSGNVYNPGFNVDEDVEVMIIREYNGNADTVHTTITGGVCKFSGFEFRLKTNKMPGVHKITIIVDPDKKINDPERKNNIYQTTFEVFKNGLLALDPLPYWNVNYKKPEFRFINPLSGLGDFDYYFTIYQETDSTSTLVSQSEDKDIDIKENYLEWKPGITLKTENNYRLEAYSRFRQDGVKGYTQVIPFNTYRQELADSVHLFTGAYSGLKDLKTTGMGIEERNNIYGLFVPDKKVTYKIAGAQNDPGIPVHRYSYIMFNDKIWLDAQQDISGLNLIVADSNRNVRYTNRYYSFYSDSTVGISLVNYLRDSVSAGEYILIATSESSFFRRETPPSKACLDTLKEVLKECGSRYADLIHNDLASLVMLSRKGYGQSIDEKIDTLGHLVQIEGYMSFLNPDAELETPMIGPAEKWKNVIVDGDVSQDSISYDLSVMGYTKEKSGEKLLASSVSSFTFGLDSVNAFDYPYIKLKMKVHRDTVTRNVFIRSIKSDFVPLPEFAMQKSKLWISADTVLRGEDAYLGYGVENISKRTVSDTNNIRVNVYSAAGNKYIKDWPVVPVAPNGSVIFNDTLVTDNYDRTNDITVSIDDNHAENELYLFNNKVSTKLSIREDTSKPWAVLKLDSIVPENGRYVQVQPWVEIEMYDLSPLAISDSSKIEVRINSIYQNTDKYIFKSYGKQRPLKASIAFRSDSLMYEDNYFTIYTQDATGNRDTMTVKVYVSKNGVVNSLINAPNPFSGSTRFMFNYLAPENGAMANIDIYNFAGQKVTTLRKTVNVGENAIDWDGFDQFGNKVPQGSYFYRMNIEGNVYVEPVFGKLIVLGN